MMQTETEKLKLTVKVANRFNRDITFCLEPWADEYLLPNGSLEIEYGENRVTIYGWSGSTCEVMQQE